MPIARHPPVHHPRQRPDSRRQQHHTDHLPEPAGHHEKAPDGHRTRRDPPRALPRRDLDDGTLRESTLHELESLGARRGVETNRGQSSARIERLVRRDLHAAAEAPFDETGTTGAERTITVEHDERLDEWLDVRLDVWRDGRPVDPSSDRFGSFHPASVSLALHFRAVVPLIRIDQRCGIRPITGWAARTSASAPLS